MLFNSLQFFVFLPCVAGLYFLAPQRARGVLLLLASYLFYMAWEPAYVLLILFSTVVDYGAGLAMGKQGSRAGRRPWLILSLCANLGMLFFFKYYNFFRDSLHQVYDWAGMDGPLPYANVLLPVGISFYTFQTLSYSIEVYRGNQSVEHRLDRFALYVAFFPQLVAGPIERAGNLLPQLAKLPGFDYERVRSGLQLIAWGLFKKVVIADRLAQCVDHVYAQPGEAPGLALIIGTVFFAFQIYCDFSGYTDMALGTAQLFGVRLMQNFRRPYSATSLSDFWSRWHISLSSWFRDYLYIPLGGNQVSKLRLALNLWVVFLFSGLWHGASWTFVIWGGIHVSFLLAERRFRSVDNPIGILRPLAQFRTFIVVCFAWVFFRAETLSDAFAVFGGLGRGWDTIPWARAIGGWLERNLNLPLWELGFSFVLLIGLAGVQNLQSKGSLRERINALPLWQRWSIYSVGLWMLFLFGVYRQKEFIYFVF